jgi:hypothetical protein
MATTVVKVVIAIMVALGKSTIPVAVVMAAVAIKGLGGSATVVAFRSRAIEIAAGIRPGPGAIVRKSARAARAAT